jgi:hypothetical protein
MYSSSNIIRMIEKKGEMGRACSRNRGKEECI